MGVTSVSFVCSSRSLISSACQEDKSVFANSDSFPNLELTLDRWVRGIFQSYHIIRDKTLSRERHLRQYISMENMQRNLKSILTLFQAIICLEKKVSRGMRGKTITTLFMDVLKRSRCMDSNRIVLLFRVVLKQLKSDTRR